MEIVNATDKNFNELINNKKVIVDFFATWCGPCKMLSPVLEQLSNEYEDITFVKVDVDDCHEISKKYGIMSVPTLMKFENGKLIDSKVGYQNIDELKKWIKAQLKM